MKRALIILLVFLFGCHSNKEQEPNTVVKKAATKKTPPAPLTPVLLVQPEEMRNAADDGYRLGPDRRILRAFADIYEILSGDPQTEPASAVFENDRWSIRCAGLAAGSLSPLFDFQEAQDQLLNWTQMLAKKFPVANNSTTTKSSPKDFDSDRLLDSLSKANEAWNSNHRTAAMFPPAAHALILLHLQTVDDLALTDELAARALALLELSKGLTGQQLPSDECLLSGSLGYTTHAARVASKLAVSDPVRLFALQQDNELEALSASKSRDPLARYLRLLRIAKQRDNDAWNLAAESQSSSGAEAIATLVTGVALDYFDLNRDASPRLRALLLAQLEGKTPDPDAADTSPAETIAAFEKILQKKMAELKGPFLTAATLQAFYRSSFYSALHKEGHFYIDELDSASDTQQFLTSIGHPTTNPAAEFQLWYTHLASTQRGHVLPNELFADLSRCRILGPELLFTTLYDFTWRTPDPYETRVPIAARTLVAAMDTRMKNRGQMMGIAHDTLLDLKLTEDLCASILRDDVADFAGDRSECALATGSFDALFALLHSPKSDKNVAYEIISLKDIPAQIEREFQKAVREFPASWEIGHAYANWLMLNNRNAECAAVARNWLKHNGNSGGFDFLNATDKLAEALYKQDKYQEAWSVAQPIVSSYTSYSLKMAALISDKLGHKEEALGYAKANAERYPDSSDARGVLAQIYWQHQQYEEATNALLKGQRLTDGDWYYTIAKFFSDYFSKQPAKETLKVFNLQCMKKMNANYSAGIIRDFAKDGKFEIAYNMILGMNRRNQADLPMLFDAYNNLKAWKNEKEALEFFRKQAPMGKEDLSTVMIDKKTYDLVWDFYPDPGKFKHPEWIWLMRSIASLKAPDDAHKKELIGYYNAHQSLLEDHIARYLLNLMSEQELLTHATNAPARCTISYFIGFRAESERRYADASDWYRVTLETSQTRMGSPWHYRSPYSWARGSLNKWTKMNKTLSQIQQAPPETLEQ